MIFFRVTADHLGVHGSLTLNVVLKEVKDTDDKDLTVHMSVSAWFIYM